ncbi:MAG: NUDIX domain-containing protein [Candidatus Coprovivens sp.]
MKEYKQLGAYGLVLDNDKILLIKKFGGPYDGKLDLPGGTIEFCERPNEALVRELKEEVGIDVISYDLFDADSVSFEWQFKEDVLVKVHHTGIFYKVFDYKNEIKNDVNVDEVNDDSLGADFYEISKLNKSMLSNIAILELEKLGYNLDEVQDLN